MNETVEKNLNEREKIGHALADIAALAAQASNANLPHKHLMDLHKELLPKFEKAVREEFKLGDDSPTSIHTGKEA